MRISRSAVAAFAAATLAFSLSAPDAAEADEAVGVGAEAYVGVAGILVVAIGRAALVGA